MTQMSPPENNGSSTPPQAAASTALVSMPVPDSMQELWVKKYDQPRKGTPIDRHIIAMRQEPFFNDHRFYLLTDYKWYGAARVESSRKRQWQLGALKAYIRSKTSTIGCEKVDSTLTSLCVLVGHPMVDPYHNDESAWRHKALGLGYKVVKTDYEFNNARARGLAEVAEEDSDKYLLASSSSAAEHAGEPMVRPERKWDSDDAEGEWED
ncbi:hypothetical protein T440DRAFT_479268 [Plenodomus tracheiphilus IPT5]|uniref:Uncharacterized protein n=1 Tax=Plenodomus tracheiphilus IPT5 TaxID=1408161 RepID=A0A6A7B585_9PLEO|nr:hypothetical protein T440DRAFT_479268 [Plenodomus tracheiphilus IPT5]